MSRSVEHFIFLEHWVLRFPIANSFNMQILLYISIVAFLVTLAVSQDPYYNYGREQSAGCYDHPKVDQHTCQAVVARRLCHNRAYGDYCCRSCRDDRQPTAETWRRHLEQQRLQPQPQQVQYQPEQDGYAYAPNQPQPEQDRYAQYPNQPQPEQDRYDPNQSQPEQDRYDPYQRQPEQDRYDPYQRQPEQDNMFYPPYQPQEYQEPPVAYSSRRTHHENDQPILGDNSEARNVLDKILKDWGQ